MAKVQRRREQREPLTPVTVEQWRASFRERYRPGVMTFMAVFDAMPRRVDEDEWRGALADELLDLLEARVGAFIGDPEIDLTEAEGRLFAAVLAVQARVKEAALERRREAADG